MAKMRSTDTPVLSLDYQYHVSTEEKASLINAIQSRENIEDDVVQSMLEENLTKKLTRGESMVYNLLNFGMSMADTARALGISQSRINKVVGHIREKYDLVLA